MGMQQAKHNSYIGQRAVVIGAGMAGLLAARVLSDHFERVTLIERDRLTESVEVRKGIPQGRHVHGLLSRGASILGELFPDLFPALIRDGTTSLDTIADACWYHFGVWAGRFPSGISGYTQSRPFLELHVRERLAARANVDFIDECEVTALCAQGGGSRVTGVHLRYHQGEQREEELAADLVVDASGRGSQAPKWLAALGYAKVEETFIRIDVGYATRIYRRPRHMPGDWKVLVIYPRPPHQKRAGYIFPIEDDCWMVTLTGWLRDYPPADEAGFLDYARSLAMPTFYEAIQDAEPLTPIATHKFPANRWRHYERMSRFPEGFVVLGDAACCFNPIYGQGMTAAALQAQSLNRCLQNQHARGDVSGLARHFQKAVAKAAAVPWLMATEEDFRYPEVEAQRPAWMGLLNWYIGRVFELAGCDRVANLRFYEVLHMLKPPIALFEPRILLAVLFKKPVLRQQF